MRNDDERLRLYLLGELPQEESDRLEQRLLVEDDLFELSDAIEAEILEARLHGELSPEQRQRVGQLLARSPRLRSRDALVRGLVQVANEDGRGTLLSFPPRIDVSRPAVRLASIAAGLLMTVGMTWLAVSLAPNGSGLRHDMGGIADNLVTPPPSPRVPAGTPAPPRDETGAVARVPDIPAPAPPAAIAAAVFQLSTLVTRDGQPEIPVLEIPADRERVELQLLLDNANTGYASYSAVLRDAREQEILSRAGLEVRNTGNGPAAVLPVPRKDLPAGRYLIELNASNEAGAAEKVGHLEVEVRR